MAAWELARALERWLHNRPEASGASAVFGSVLCELIAEAGFPDRVVKRVAGFGEVAGAALAKRRSSRVSSRVPVSSRSDMDRTVGLGPLLSKEQRSRLTGLLEWGQQQRAEVTTVG
jgi:acyl-CoA reductase-like NAD-dependent aldehyde dehydrogenase